jgi:hypothetical protein
MSHQQSAISNQQSKILMASMSNQQSKIRNLVCRLHVKYYELTYVMHRGVRRPVFTRILPESARKLPQRGVRETDKNVGIDFAE